MKLKRLELQNFRNIQGLIFEPTDQVNIITGLNGQGKTSLLEAISILSQTRSFRDSSTDAWITSEMNQSNIRGYFENEFGVSLNLSVMLNNDPFTGKLKKTFQVNQKASSAQTQYLQKIKGESPIGFHAISFNPNDHDLIRGEPKIRRDFFDQILFSIYPNSISTFTSYSKTLLQRNKLLKSEVFDLNLFDSYTQKLIEHGAEILIFRLNLAKKTQPIVDNLLHQIAPHQGSFSLRYLFNSGGNSIPKTLDFYGHTPVPDLELMVQELTSKSHVLRDAERMAQTTLFGPHRDDWVFLCGEESLKQKGSQGEVRSLLLGVKLSEIQIFEEATKVQPILLLDDFSSELDSNRRSMMIELLEKARRQVFITTTESLSVKGKEFKISKGNWEGIADSHGDKPYR